MAFHLFESGKQTLSKISGTIRQEHNRSDSRSLHITGATGIFSILLGLGKIISGIVSLSVFECMNGCRDTSSARDLSRCGNQPAR